ncbi:MAG: hypothetical protein ACLRTQ_01980 [Candidatus Borkfalkia sp.]
MAEMSGEININILFPNGEGGNVSTDSENGNPAAPVNVGQPNADNPAASGSKSVSVAAGVNVAMSLGKQAMEQSFPHRARHRTITRRRGCRALYRVWAQWRDLLWLQAIL